MTEALTARASIQREGVNLIISFKSFLRPEAAAAAKASDGMNLPSVLSEQERRRRRRRRRFSTERPRAAPNGDPLQVPAARGEGIWASGQCETLELKQELDNNSSLKPAEGAMWRGQRASMSSNCQMVNIFVPFHQRINCRAAWGLRCTDHCGRGF